MLPPLPVSGFLFGKEGDAKVKRYSVPSRCWKDREQRADICLATTRDYRYPASSAGMHGK